MIGIFATFALWFFMFISIWMTMSVYHDRNKSSDGNEDTRRIASADFFKFVDIGPESSGSEVDIFEFECTNGTRLRCWKLHDKLIVEKIQV